MKKLSTLFLASSLAVALAACQQSEIDNKTAAEVSDTNASVSTTAPETQPAANAVRADVIKEKSSINFVGAKVTRDHQGKFNDFDGAIEYVAGKPERISFDIDLNSIETDTEKLTGHLKSADFFDVAKHPRATFTSTSLTPAPAGNASGATHILTGTLDMHGVKKDVTVPVKAEQTAEGVRATSEFTINRHDWGISYRGAVDDLIKDEVLMRLDLFFPPPPAAA
jgi:polyisoprenoid-binding protein YceI